MHRRPPLQQIIIDKFNKLRFKISFETRASHSSSELEVLNDMDWVKRQIEDLSGKVQDIENQNNLLFDKLDDLVNQNLNLSDKLDSDLDLKLDLASVKIDEKSDLKYKALEEKVLNIQTEMLNQTQNLKDNFENLQTQLTNSMSQMSNEKNEILIIIDYTITIISVSVSY